MNQGVCCNAFIRNHNGEVLLLKRSKTDEAFPENWELPGGGVDYGETMPESLVREIKEECGLLIDVHHPIAVNNFYIDKIQYFEVTYLCTVKDDYNVVISPEHSEFIWTKTNQVDKIGISDYMKRTLLDSERALEQ